MKSDNWHILGCPSVLVFLCAAFPNLAHSFLATPVKATLSRVLYSWTTWYFPFIVRKVRRKHLMDHYSYIKWRPVLKPPGSAPLKSKLAVGNWLSAITVPIFIAVWVHQPSTSDAISQEKMNLPTYGGVQAVPEILGTVQCLCWCPDCQYHPGYPEEGATQQLHHHPYMEQVDCTDCPVNSSGKQRTPSTGRINC